MELLAESESYEPYDKVEVKTNRKPIVSGRKRKPSNPSVALSIPIATPFFDLHSNVRLLTLPTPSPLPITSLVGTVTAAVDTTIFAYFLLSVDFTTDAR